MTNSNDSNNYSYQDFFVPVEFINQRDKSYFVTSIDDLTSMVNSSLKERKLGYSVTEALIAQDIYRNRVEGGYDFKVDSEGFFESQIPSDLLKKSFFQKLFLSKKEKNRKYFIQVFDVVEKTGFYK